MDILLSRMPEKMHTIVNKFISCILAVFSAIIIREGIALMILGQHQRSSALMIPMNIVYLAVPLGGAIMLFYSIMLLIKKGGAS